MKIDLDDYRERIRFRKEALDGNTFAHANKMVRVEFGLKVPVGELEILLEVYAAALAWRAHPVHCRDDSYDRDEAFAEVIERVTR